VSVPLAAASKSAPHEAGEGVACSQCPVARVCLPADIPPDQRVRLEAMVVRQRTLEAGQYLFRVGEPFTCLFAVRSGSLKSTVFDPDGREHILNFHLPGEVLGFAAIYQQRHAGNAVALTASNVCYLSFSEILRLAQEFPQLVLALLRIASRSSLYTGRLTGDHNATVRVAAFLLSVSGRLRAQGQCATEFELIMSREDIANHLRLAPETVSRVFTQLRTERVIGVNRRLVRLLDETRLQALAGPMMPYG
jgi:CRP/FNR family transcriptional regulator